MVYVAAVAHQGRIQLLCVMVKQNTATANVTIDNY